MTPEDWKDPQFDPPPTDVRDWKSFIVPHSALMWDYFSDTEKREIAEQAQRLATLIAQQEPPDPVVFTQDRLVHIWKDPSDDPANVKSSRGE